MSAREEAKLDREDALETLTRIYPKGSTVYTVLRRVSRSGMSRHISLLGLSVGLGGVSVVDLHPNWAASKVLGLRLSPQGAGYDAVVITGCGMDMGLELAYRLGSALYGDGYALKHRWL